MADDEYENKFSDLLPPMFIFEKPRVATVEISGVMYKICDFYSKAGA